MADVPNKTGGAHGWHGPPPDVPQSQTLQWFLVVALVISAAACVVQQWAQFTSRRTQVQIRRLAQSQGAYLAHWKAGEEAFAARRFERAEAEYRLALQSQNNALVHKLLGETLLKEGNPDAAFAEFVEALRLNPKLPEVSSAWGQALMAEGEPDQASRILREGLERNPGSGLLDYNLATALLQMRANVEGRRHIAAGAGKKQDAQAAQIESDKLAGDALRHFASASRSGIDSPAFWCGYGQLLNQLGQYAQAETCLVRAVKEDAGMARAHFDLAVSEHHLGNYAQAIAHYENVLMLRPNDPATLINLALLYATATNSEARSPKMAVQLAARACDATISQNARYMDTLARAHAAAGDFFQAITWEDKAIHRARQLSDEELARELEAREALFMDHKTQ